MPSFTPDNCPLFSTLQQRTASFLAPPTLSTRRQRFYLMGRLQRFYLMGLCPLKEAGLSPAHRSPSSNATCLATGRACIGVAACTSCGSIENALKSPQAPQQAGHTEGVGLAVALVGVDLALAQPHRLIDRRPEAVQEGSLPTSRRSLPYLRACRGCFKGPIQSAPWSLMRLPTSCPRCRTPKASSCARRRITLSLSCLCNT